jgi:Ribbon-helix-helix protein, copG family
MSDDSFDASAEGRTTESGAAVARGRGRTPAPLAENSITITLKMPESLARGLRDHASKRSVTTSEVVRQAVAAFLAAKRRHG